MTKAVARVKQVVSINQYLKIWDFFIFKNNYEVSGCLCCACLLSSRKWLDKFIIGPGQVLGYFAPRNCLFEYSHLMISLKHIS